MAHQLPTPEQFDALIESGIIGQPVEFVDGHWRAGGYIHHFTPAQSADARQLGITLPTCESPGSAHAVNDRQRVELRERFPEGIRTGEGIDSSDPQFRAQALRDYAVGVEAESGPLTPEEQIQAERRLSS